MRFSGIVVLLAVVLTNLFVWHEGNHPIQPSESSYPMKSLSYNPFQRDQSPLRGQSPNASEIKHDLEILSNRSQTLRLYSSTGILETMPELIKGYDFRLIASAWLDADTEANRQEVDATIKLAGRNRSVSRIIIGNETQLRKSVPAEELISYLRKARKQLRTPVSTAEPWDFWVNNPEFVNEVDYIAIHILPYWLEVPIEEAVDYVFNKYQAVKGLFPYKMVMIAETGWPSDGPQRGRAEATLENQARFIREFLHRAEKQKINYNLIEAFDQPWKSETEGSAGEHWGIMTADRKEKFPISGPVLEDPKWRYWALSSTIIGALGIAIFLGRKKQLKVQGQLFSAVILQGASTLMVLLAQAATDEYMSPGDIMFWTVMIAAQVLLAIIFVTDAAEIAEVVGEEPLKRRFLPAPRLPQEEYPFVSLHLACCKEPPEMVISTLTSLAKLDYPRFEVIVVDNNTTDETLWRPIERYCQEQGERFRFFSLGTWPGFKAGALNFALSKTDPQAEVIGVIDADYVVHDDWLATTIPHFRNEKVAVVQAPQEHRGWEECIFRKMENDEYSGFFRIGMVQRNEDNAIIQHGTMTLIRKKDLNDVGGWAEWCICEDAELGLRLLRLGKEVIYIDHVYGRGLVPDSYEAYAKQRFRWAYGAMRIMRRHAGTLLGFKKGLTPAQRYQFIKGWLPWIGDALHMLFTFAALIWSAVILSDPLQTEFPEPIFVYPAILLVLLRFFGTYWTYRTRVKIGKRRTIVAMIAGGSLTHTIAKAVFQGLLTSKRPFYRTPKMKSPRPLLRSIIATRDEIVLTISLLGCTYGIYREYGFINSEAILWMIALLTQSLPYLSAIVAAMLSSLSAPLRKIYTLRASSNIEGDSALRQSA